MAKSSSLSKTAIWILLALLILGLAGFGAANLGGNLRSLGSVGDKPVSVQQYGRAIQQELRALNQQAGRPVSFAEAQTLGVDRNVLARLVRERALDHETTQMGLSVGDASLRDRIVEISAFQGIDGEFDRDGYRMSLRQAGLSETEFEATLREEAARNLLQGALVGATQMPDTYARTLVNFVREERDFTWAALTEDNLDAPIAEATDADLRAYFEANADDYVLPLTKNITYAVLTPETLLDDVDVTEEELRAAYDARAEQYNQPERRLVERLAFADEDSANQAAANLDVGGTTFEALVADRGLELSDVDLGDVGKADLDGAGDAVFAAAPGDVVGPLPSSLGPALFRINGVLPALETSFEDAEAELRGIVAGDRAQRVVEALAEDFDDQLAGGATLEQLADETQMRLGTIEWTAGNSDGIAAYEGFREVAATVSTEDFPQIEQLEDGGIFALRLDQELPQRPAAFEDVAERVAEDWRVAEITKALRAKAEAALPSLREGAAFTASGLQGRPEIGLTRNAFVESTPAGFMSAVFEMAPGDVRTVEGGGVVAIVRLNGITAPDEDAEGLALIAQVQAQQSQELARSLYNIFANDALLRAGQNIDPRAVQAVNVNFQ